MEDYTRIDSYDRYELLRFSKWNRRLLNLYWIFNGIILFTEIALFFIIDKVGSLFYPVKYHLIYLILIPTAIMLGVTGLCEILVVLFKDKRRGLLPYVMTFTSIVYCSVVLAVHDVVVVLCVTFIVPVIISLVYDNKNVLRWTTVGSLAALATVSAIAMNFGDPNYNFLDLPDVITAAVILIATYLLCGTVLNRNRDIIKTLVAAEHAAYELETAKSRAEAVAESRTLFLANMSHEIRTPMNGIIGLTELALDDETLSRKQMDYLRKINRSAQGLVSIVNDILDMSKIDAGKITLEKTPFYLHEVLAECKVSIMPSAEEKGIRFVVRDKTDLSEKITGDPTKLRQALLNFLSNAVKFTEKGLVTLFVKRENLSGNKTKVYFEITDTGIGIPPEQQATIFEPFAQADGSTTRKFGGTGLGLSITKNIIEKMGGKIYVESAPNVGSKFSFELVFELSDYEYNAKKEIPETAARHPVFEGTVLVCEDNELNRQVAMENLVKLGFSVIMAENGKLGIDEVTNRKENPFDVIFMDIHMPVMDGFSAARELIKMGVKTPIIAMTADVMPADRERCLQLGMAGYISKPFKLQDIWLCLLKHLTPVEPVDGSEGCSFMQSGETFNGESRELHDYKEDVLIDRVIGIENSAGSEALYRKMLAHFAERKRGNYDKLKKSIENKDYMLAWHIAHEEKGSVQIIGAVRLIRILNDLEEAFVTGDSRRYTGLMKTYSIELDKVLEHIENQNVDI